MPPAGGPEGWGGRCWGVKPCLCSTRLQLSPTPDDGTRSEPLGKEDPTSLSAENRTTFQKGQLHSTPHLK